MDSFVAAFAPSLRGRGASEPTRATVHRNPISASVLSEGKYLLTCFPSVSFELFCITSFCFHFASRRTLHQLIVLLNWCKQIICLCSLQNPPEPQSPRCQVTRMMRTPDHFLPETTGLSGGGTLPQEPVEHLGTPWRILWLTGHLKS